MSRRSPSIDQLRSLWRMNSDPTVRAVIEELVLRRREVERLHRKLGMVGQLYRAINDAWKDEVGGKLIALEHLKALIHEEQVRSGQLPHMPRSSYDQ